MTLDEAIRHCLEQAHKLQDKADRVDGEESRQCMECSADHIQLAEWLVELKDLRAEQHEQSVFIKELMKHTVRRGKWLQHGKADDYFWCCSACKKWIIYAEHDLYKHHFCGNCGADMRETETTKG